MLRVQQPTQLDAPFPCVPSPASAGEGQDGAKYQPGEASTAELPAGLRFNPLWVASVTRRDVNFC